MKRRLVPDKQVIHPTGRQSVVAGRENRVGDAAAAVLGTGRASAIGRGTCESSSTAGARGSVLGGVRGSVLGRFSVVASQTVSISGAPFDFVICACAGLSMLKGVESITCTDLFGGSKDVDDAEDGSAVDITSLHLIGIEDPLKTSSESVAKQFMGAKV